MAKIYYQYDPNKEGDKEKQEIKAILGYCGGLIFTGGIIFLIVMLPTWIKSFFQWSGSKVIFAILVPAVIAIFLIRYYSRNKQKVKKSIGKIKSIFKISQRTVDNNSEQQMINKTEQSFVIPDKSQDNQFVKDNTTNTVEAINPSKHDKKVYNSCIADKVELETKTLLTGRNQNIEDNSFGQDNKEVEPIISISEPEQHFYNSNEDSDTVNSDNAGDVIGIPEIQYCRKCGFKLLKGSVYCSKCGAKVQE